MARCKRDLEAQRRQGRFWEDQCKSREKRRKRRGGKIGNKRRCGNQILTSQPQPKTYIVVINFHESYTNDAELVIIVTGKVTK
jgi:hypothetical protein